MNELGKTIEEVKIAVYDVPQVPKSQDNLGPSEVSKLQRPTANQPIMVQILGGVLDLGTPESNEVAKSAG